MIEIMSSSFLAGMASAAMIRLYRLWFNREGR